MIKPSVFTIGAALLGTVSVAPASAQTDKPFSGPYVAATGGWDRVDGHNRKSTGFAYGGTVGYDIAGGDARVGPEVELLGSTAKRCVGVAAARNCSRAGRDIFVGGRIGAVVAPPVLLYVTAGYTNAHLDRYEPGDDKDILDKKARSGGRLGAGVEYAITPAAFIKTEYRYSRYSGGISRNQILGSVGLRF